MNMRPFTSGLNPQNLATIQHGTLRYSYRGIKTAKDPFDFALYPLLIWNLKPRTIIEIGSNMGGSAVWLADTLKTFGIDGHIHSVDINLVTWITHPGVTFYGGDAGNLRDTFSHEFMESLPRPVLLIEDSDHQYATCLKVMEFFAPYLHRGEYMLVEDGIVDMLGISSQFDGGPNRAIKEFLEKHAGEYAIDTAFCDFFGPNFTYNINGYLVKQ
jgi:cephalosporin hydroxylase